MSRIITPAPSYMERLLSTLQNAGDEYLDFYTAGGCIDAPSLLPAGSTVGYFEWVFTKCVAREGDES